MTRQVPTSRVLSDLLREDLALKGTNVACGRTVCGACTVLIDGVPRAACSTFAFEIEGAEVLTVEGLEGPDGLDPVQQAFARLSAFQCGFCTPGMILLVRALLDEVPDPDTETIRAHISSNICRCTGYGLILEAVKLASDIRSGKAAALPHKEART
ncbi:MAG: (2Fe-2S)-binding protein [Rhodobacteraceae bacterium]|nr:(2Fe-2S)-binding protein [Paracoccaceae bacterium]